MNCLEKIRDSRKNRIHGTRIRLKCSRISRTRDRSRGRDWNGTENMTGTGFSSERYFLPVQTTDSGFLIPL